MRNLKKTLALLLAAGMTLAMVGCGQEKKTENDSVESSTVAESSFAAEETSSVPEEPKDPVVLEWYFRGNGQQKDTEEVEARVNELLKEYPGLEHVSIHINCFTSSDYATQVQLAQTTGAQIDILNSVNLGTFSTLVQDGNWMPMDEYISDDLRAALPDWLWEMGSIDGKTYIVPNYQNAYNISWLAFPKEYMDKYGNYDEMSALISDPDASIDDKMKCLEDFAVACDKGEEGHKYASMVCGFRNQLTGSQGFPFMTPYDYLDTYFVVEDGSKEVSFLFENENLVEICKNFARWGDMGIAQPDGASTEQGNYTRSHIMDETSMVWTSECALGSAEDVAAGLSASYGFDVVVIQTQPYHFIQNTWGAGGNGISATCEHPEEAAAFLEAITTGTELGKEIYNTLVFGIEGKHYTKDANDPDRITTLEYDGSQGGGDTSYAGLKWIIGNTFNAYKNQAVLDGQYEKYKELNESKDTVSSSLIGFTVDKTNVSVEIDQINAIVAELSGEILIGSAGEAGFDAYYDEFIDKLNKAGLEKVKAEYQSQLDAWLAANK